MKNIIAGMSVIFGAIAAVLVFTSLFKTPPIPILLFATLGIIAGLFGVKSAKLLSVIGILLSAVSFLYLVYLFIQLGG